MVNKPRQKGTAAESACTKWLRLNGFPHADRQPLRGGLDQGDIAVTAGIVAEIKSHAGGPSLGQPSAGVLTEWMRQAETERVNAGAAHCMLVVKRKGTSDPGRWWTYLPLVDMADLLGAPVAPPEPHAPVCLSLASAVALLRASGYGDPTTNATGATQDGERVADGPGDQDAPERPAERLTEASAGIVGESGRAGRAHADREHAREATSDGMPVLVGAPDAQDLTPSQQACGHWMVERAICEASMTCVDCGARLPSVHAGAHARPGGVA